MQKDHRPFSATSMTNMFPVAEGLVLDVDSDRPHIEDDSRNVEGVKKECGQEIGASCAITVPGATQQAK